tara:strand:- start:1864 stop:2355 length:492 start_codon:yes stop_codon:yes gene_type:complete
MVNFNGRVKMSKQDNYNTPLKGWTDILQFINKDANIWCPFYNDGKLLEHLNSLHYNNVYHEEIDFFEYWKDDHILIDNPPYSIKEEIIKRCYDKNISFALLLPLDTIERKYIYKYKNNLQLVMPTIRYNYTEGNGTPPFKSVWFCWNMNQYLNSNKDIVWLNN